jgi:hypothetical protein
MSMRLVIIYLPTITLYGCPAATWGKEHHHLSGMKSLLIQNRAGRARFEVK